MMWWFAALALAQDPSTEEPVAPEPADETLAPEEGEPGAIDEEVDAEMTVYGRLAIDRALDDVVDKMEGLGYTAKRDGERVVFRPPLGWMGKAVLEDGKLDFRRSVAGIAGPDDSVNMELFRRIDPNKPPTEGYGLRLWLLPAEKKVEPLRAEVREAVGPELSRYNAVVARTALQERLASLPDRLDAVWSDGTPLAGTAALGTATDRRLHILEYWATRSSTPEGRLTARAVADWLEAVVQDSDAPITGNERSRYEARRGDGLELPR
ncbi:MAG: hypothetical protein AAF602_07605 [Myxococcota bacterium]